MPVTYFSSTGPVLFTPVPHREQAVGPISVSAIPSPPDETIEALRSGYLQSSDSSTAILSVAAISALCCLIYVVAIS
jgi:hypothetical protein